MQRHYVGEVGKSITFVLHIYQFASCQILQKLVNISTHYSNEQGDCFLTHTVLDEQNKLMFAAIFLN